MPNDKGLLRGERGSAMVELAICAPVLCLLFVGSIEFHKLTNYKRKVIAATRYACWEVVARKGEANLERTVATEMRNLFFPEIPFDAATAVVSNFTADNSVGSRVQLKVEKMGSLNDLTDSGFTVWGTMVAEVAVKKHDLLGVAEIGYGLVPNDDNQQDDRIKTTVRMTYQPTFFPIVMNFFTLDKYKQQEANALPPSWNVQKNLMSVGGDVTFARMVLCNGTWDAYTTAAVEDKIKGMYWPHVCFSIGDILNDIGDALFGAFDITWHADLDLVCPYSYNPGDGYLNATDWWQSCSDPKKPCRCTHDEDSRFEDGGDAEDPTQTMQAEQEEYENTKRELEERIAADEQRLGEIEDEKAARLNDDDPNNDDISDLEEEQEAVEADKAEAESQLRQIEGGQEGRPNE